MLRLALGCVGFFNAVACRGAELVYLDESGVIRWTADQREVALFGANYSLPSAGDYRAAGYINADRKKLVEKDLAHFARMGWDGMRLCLWGDWENCDQAGNLIVNDHLDVMDYAIAQAKQRGVSILFTPITTYSSWWPDGKPTDPNPGFSRLYPREQLVTDPRAIVAECNFLRQIMEHVNPYTGVALKDEPAILFVEMINEPASLGNDLAGGIAYIDHLADAVRSTGCKKILFYNVSQDFRMTPAIKASTVPGVAFAWYPTGLNNGHQLNENYLRSVDDFGPMLRPDLLRVPKIVYEFDSPDMLSGCMYPAMTRAFRGVGAQFAAMFSYDMLDTAPYNLGWQTHFLNLVYTPTKAVGAIIAAEAMRTLPRYSFFGDYPDNCRFGPFRVSYEEDLSEMVTDEKYLYAGDTRTVPSNLAKLKHLVGVGSSPVVAYEGVGAYFLDRLAAGVWRLELYPDAVIVQDPFAQQLNYRTVSSRLVARAWPMRVQLPDLGDAFAVKPLNEGNTHSASAHEGVFEARPGVYLLSHDANFDPGTLPQKLGKIGLREFVCPPAPDLPAQVLPLGRGSYAVDRPVEVAADVIAAQPAGAVTLHLRTAGDAAFRAWPMPAQHGYRHAARIPAGTLPAGTAEYFFSIETEGGTIRSPEDVKRFLTTQVVMPNQPLPLFDGAQDIPHLVYTRIGDNLRHGVFKSMPATDADPAALRLLLPLSYDRTLDDYTASLAIKDRIFDRSGRLAAAKALRVKARGASADQSVFLTLVEADGTSWSTRLSLPSAWQEVIVPLAGLRIAQGVKLPLGYPERWNYWVAPAKRRGGSTDRPNLAAVEHVQISLRPESGGPKPKGAGADAWADIASVALTFE
jgi:hypothetical protein